MTKYPMWMKCQIQIQVQQVGQKFQTMEECPAGNQQGIEPSELMSRCMSCPKAEPQPLADVAIRPKKKLCPTPRKKS